MTLTEQWKKGELEWGKNYYCRNVKTNETNICFLYGSTWYSADSDGEGDIDWQGSLEVLAPVPSYEEYLRLGKKIKKRCVQIQKVTGLALKRKKEIKKLKELLGKCRTMLGQFEIKNPEPTTYDVVETILKIDNAIREK